MTGRIAHVVVKVILLAFLLCVPLFVIPAQWPSFSVLRYMGSKVVQTSGVVTVSRVFGDRIDQQRDRSFPTPAPVYQLEYRYWVSGVEYRSSVVDPHENAMRPYALSEAVDRLREGSKVKVFHLKDRPADSWLRLSSAVWPLISLAFALIVPTTLLIDIVSRMTRTRAPVGTTHPKPIATASQHNDTDGHQERQGNSRVTSRAKSALLGVPIIIAAVLLYQIWDGFEYKRYLPSSKPANTQGVVERSRTRVTMAYARNSTNPHGALRWDFQYRYQVDGKWYRSNVFDPENGTTADRHVETMVAAIKEGDPVTVNYLPGNPGAGWIELQMPRLRIILSLAVPSALIAFYIQIWRSRRRRSQT